MLILEIYFIGWLLTGTTQVLMECTEEQSRITKGECVALVYVTSAAWPYTVPKAIIKKIRD